ncbi:acyl-CoA dehydrogenase family protein [Aquibaculum sediminis]|uniref:acyl-CoA dehydrogenase family protein n=1 Tax=Aquibaculum sediminis TaxID=3231907 RepID=UPI003454640E
MSTMEAEGLGFATHEVLNQTGDLADYNSFAGDWALQDAIRVFGAAWAEDRLQRAGERVGSAAVQQLARQANRNLPELKTHNRFGERIDQVEFHPAWHELMGLIFDSETHSLSWTETRAGAQVARAALSYLWNQGESGICCPMGMTYASMAALEHQPNLKAQWQDKILSRSYDPRPLHAAEKRGATVGMAMTEKQGGSDLRATMTTARPAGRRTGPGAEYLLTGHKWFFSVPQSDLFLTLAQTETGLSCFLACGWLPDGTRNRLKLQRLKDKCGNKSNASSEVEFYDLHAHMVGEEGRGIRTIIEMAHLTRLDFAVGSSGLMRQALSHALHHVRKRRAFQRSLVDLPIMRNVAADLAVESEAMMWMSLRLAHAADRSQESESERLLARIATPMAKYWACKRAPAFVAEALECHGGNGFIEDHLMARLYREAPLNGIWEGTGNVICLDVIRSMQREPETRDAFLDEVRAGLSGDARLRAFTEELAARLADLPRAEGQARRTVEMMAFALQGSLLARHSSPAVSDAFSASRLSGEWGQAFGTLPEGLDTEAIVARAAVPD